MIRRAWGLAVALTGSVWRSFGDLFAERVSVKMMGALGNGGDDTVAIQKALDLAAGDSPLVVFFPRTTAGYGVTGLRIRNSNVRLKGLGGRVKIKFIGTRASAGAVIRCDKDLDHLVVGENYQNVQLENLELDGGRDDAEPCDGRALHGFLAHGFTKRCRLINVEIHACVNPIRVTDGFYSSYDNVQVHSPPFYRPVSGGDAMAAPTYAANLYGAYFDVCHAMRLQSFVFFNLGGADDAYAAALWLRSSEGVRMSSFTMEEMRVANSRRMTRLLEVQGCTFDANSGYIEEVDTAAEVIRSHDGTTLGLANVYFNGVTAPALLQGDELAPITLRNDFGINLHISDRLLRVSSGAGFRSLWLEACSFLAGPQNGTVHDAGALSTAAAKLGLACDPVLLDTGGTDGFIGFRKRGLDLSIAGNYVVCGPGESNSNGQAVGLGRSSGVSQRVLPDLSVAGTWNAMQSNAGSFYVELQSAPRPGSAYALRLGTFTTPGGGGAPTALVTVNSASSRLTGQVYLPVPTSNAFLFHRLLTGAFALADAGAAANTDTLQFTLSAGGGEDDAIGAIVPYFLTTTSGLTCSAEIGLALCTFARAADGVCTASVTKLGFDQSKAAGMATMVTTFSMSVAGNVATLRLKNETSADVASRVMFGAAHVMGGNRATAAAAMSASMTSAL
jgi:hypothetical protein